MDSSFRRSGKRRGQRFDAENNVVTESLLFLSELDPEAIGEAMMDATHYEPTPIAQAQALLDALPEKIESFTLLDIGAGMGRIVMLASMRPFKQAIGVEVSAALCEVARDNLVRWRRRHGGLPCKDLRIVCGGAADAPLPRGDLAVYLFNPFGERTLQTVVRRLASHGAALWVLYHTPVHRSVFDGEPAFVLEQDLGFGLVYRKG